MPFVHSAQDTPPEARLDAEAIGALYRERLRGEVRDVAVAHGKATVTVAPEVFARAAALAQRDPALDMDFFDFLTAVDLGEEGFAVVARVYSTRLRHDVLLRTVADGGREAPSVPTLTEVYRGANWHERETYDMFGIDFDGHPGLEPRILTVPNFEGWPLRKDFLLTTREIKPWPGEKEPKEAAGGDAGEGGGQAEGGPDAEDKAAAAKAKAERAKQKAAEMRKKKAQERAAREADEGDGGEAS